MVHAPSTLPLHQTRIAVIDDATLQHLVDAIDQLQQKLVQEEQDVDEFMAFYYRAMLPYYTVPDVSSLLPVPARKSRVSNAPHAAANAPAEQPHMPTKSSDANGQHALKHTLKKLYHTLAKEYHPDSGQSQTRDPALFAEIHDAYQAGSVAKLQSITRRTMLRSIRSQSLRAAMTQAYYEELQQALTVLETQARTLHATPEFRLMRRYFESKLCGVDIIAQLQESIRQRYTEATDSACN